MPHVSKHKLSEKQQEKLLATFHLVVAKIKKTDDIAAFFLSFLSPTEQLMLAKRLAVMILLKEGEDDSTIANHLHVTRVTVGRLRYFLEARGEGFDAAVRVLENEKLFEEVKATILSLAKYAARAAGGRVNPSPF